MSIEKGDATKYVHTGNGELCYELNKALTVPETFPIYLSSAYIFDSIDPIDKICDEGAPGYAYFRLGNPNADATSQILAAGDGAEKGLVFSSGMAAITTSILATVKPGDHIVASPIIYGEAFYYLKYELKRWGVETTFIDFNTQDVADYIRPNTKLVYGETIANPLMSVPDIQHLADVAHANGAKLFIDNTFATSIIAKPIKYGADLVIYSATKYLGGHDDLIVPVLCIGIGIAVGQCAGPDRAIGRGDLKLGRGDPVGQDELRHGIGEGAQLLHGQVRRAFVGLVDLISQHRDDPAPAVGLEGLLTEGDGLLRQGIRPGAAVKKSRRSAQDGGNHNGDHHKPKQQFTHIVFSPWQYGIAKKAGRRQVGAQPGCGGRKASPAGEALRIIYSFSSAGAEGMFS